MSPVSLTPTELAAHKGDRRASVCLPAHNEASTIGAIVETVRRELIEATALVDEIVVIDDASTDDTAAQALDAGARVERTQAVLPDTGTRRGKGEALWKSVAASDGDVIVWLDADLTSFDPAFVTGLLTPLLTDARTTLVKGYYERPVGDDELGGGRVTELVARPLLATWFPELTSIQQPLGGEYAARRDVVERVRFAGGYGVDIGLLIDVANGWGVDTIAQVDLGVRHHRNRPLHELGPQALAVMTTTLRRAGLDVSETPVLRTPDGVIAPVDVRDRPPLAQLPGYRATATTTVASGLATPAPGTSDARLAEFVGALTDVPVGDAVELVADVADATDDPLEAAARAVVRGRHRNVNDPPGPRDAR